MTIIIWFIVSIICCILLCQKFPSQKISPLELYGINNSNLKDFNLSNNTLFSTSTDPWITYDTSFNHPILTIDIIQSNIQTRNLRANIYDTASWKHITYSPTNGHNLILCHPFQPQQLRFDLVENQFQTITLKEILINSKQSIILLVFTISSELLLCCFLSIDLWKNKIMYSPNIYRLHVLALLFAPFIIFLSLSSYSIYANTILLFLFVLIICLKNICTQL